MGIPSVDRLGAVTDAELAALRARFHEAGFTPEVLALAESVAPGQLDAVALPLVRWTLRSRGNTASRLALLFSYADAFRAREVEQDLGPALVDALRRGGVLGEGPGGLACPFRLVPIDGLWILGDEPSAGPEAVMGPGPTTLELLTHLPARFPGAALDLGTGAGTFALALASRGAERVVATDLNPRAARIASFNARLNGLKLDVRVGDLEAPVREERFGFVVSQPAYVFQPPDEPAVVFLHGGPRGDELAFRLLAALPALLEDEATALILFDTPLEPGHPLPSRVRSALGPDGLDLLLLTAPGPSPGAQAVAYAALAHPELGEAYGESVQRHREHLRQLGHREWKHVLARIQRTGRAPFTVQLPVPGLLTRGPGALEGLLSGIEAAMLPEDRLRAVPLSPLPGLRFLGELTLEGELEALQAQPGRGSLATACPLGGDDLALLRALATAPEVGAALEALAGDGPDPGWLERIRELAGRGLLVDRRVAGRVPEARGPR